MGTIEFILSLGAVVVAGGAAIFIMLFPLLFDADLKKRTGKGIVNYSYTAD